MKLWATSYGFPDCDAIGTVVTTTKEEGIREAEARCAEEDGAAGLVWNGEVAYCCTYWGPTQVEQEWLIEYVCTAETSRKSWQDWALAPTCRRKPMKNCTDCGVVTDSPWFQRTEDGNLPICRTCADARHLADLRADGKGMLYDCDSYLTLAGTIKLQPWSRYGWGQKPVHRKADRKRHNIARWRYDTWFRLPGDEFIWHGVRYGDNTQILHCRRTKRRKWSDS